MLPDIDTLKDRMSLTCYDSGLVEGVDSKVAALALLAIDVRLRTSDSLDYWLICCCSYLDTFKINGYKCYFSDSF